MNVLDLQVGAGKNDVYHRGYAHDFFTSAIHFVAGNNAGEGGNNSLMDAAARFTGVEIHKDSTIIEAHLTLTARVSDSLGVVRTYFKAEQVANAASITDEADWHSRNLTVNMQPWWNIPAWSYDAEYQSPDLSLIIQELVDLSDWVHGNAINIFWLDDGSDFGMDRKRNAHSWNSDPAKAPKLHIEFMDHHGCRRRTHWTL